MRGTHEEQEVMLAYVNLEERVPKDHPLRTMKAVADEALGRLSPEFDRMHSNVGRASVPPERLLKASLLISLHSVRSERAICETGRRIYVGHSLAPWSTWSPWGASPHCLAGPPLSAPETGLPVPCGAGQETGGGCPRRASAIRCT